MTDDQARLVAFVAREVMGWTSEYLRDRWDPLTNDFHAGQMLDRMAAKGFGGGCDLIRSSSTFYETKLFKHVSDEPTTRGHSRIEVQGDPPTEQDFRTARLEAVTLAAARAMGWSG